MTSFYGEHIARERLSVTASSCVAQEKEGRKLWHVGPSWLVDKRWAQLALCSEMGSEFAAADLGCDYIVELRLMAN